MNEAKQILDQAWHRAISGPEAINAPATVILLAKQAARKAVKRKFQAQGVKMSYIEVRAHNKRR